MSMDSHKTGGGSLLRPFVMTGGRTRARVPLRVETILRTTATAEGAVVDLEKREILDLLTDPLSVAEVSAHLKLPLGVATVLVSDLVADGHIATSKTERIEISLLERVLEGVKAL